jgi:hypothetical protein
VAEEVTKFSGADLRTAHERHGSTFAARSKRPLQNRIDQQPLPPIRRDAINELSWPVISDTLLDRLSKPTFAKHLHDLDGLQVGLAGFMQPLGDEPEMATFILVEFPVGCWFCEMPDMTGIVMVALRDGKTTPHTRALMKIEGTLQLNPSDPERFLYTISNAQVKEIE